MTLRDLWSYLKNALDNWKFNFTGATTGYYLKLDATAREIIAVNPVLSWTNISRATIPWTRVGTLYTLTMTAHKLTTGDTITVTNSSSPTALANSTYTVTVIDANTFTVVSANNSSTAGNCTVSLFFNSWLDFGGVFRTCRFTKDERWVYMEGFISSGATGTVAITLPTGYRPAAAVRIASTGGGGFAYLDITNNGNITVICPSGANGVSVNFKFGI